MDPELANWLAHRRHVSHSMDEGEQAADDDQADARPAQAPSAPVSRRKMSAKDMLLSEFRDMSYKQFKCLVDIFENFDVRKEGRLGIAELKRLMEHLGDPQTHVALRKMIQEVDEDQDGKVNLREFFLLYRKAVEVTDQNSPFKTLAALESFDVGAEGVRSAKGFFEAKMKAVAGKDSIFEEIKEEQEGRKKEIYEKQQRKESFKARQAMFEDNNLLPA